MGNLFRNLGSKRCDQPQPKRISSLPIMDLEPTLRIPVETEMSQSEGNRLRFRVRHAATDFPAIVEAHKDHKIATLKRHLVEQMGMPFPSEDGKCKILMVWNKPDLLRDEPLRVDGTSGWTMDQRYLGGSIDHLSLGTYGLENGDFLMFTVMFPQILSASVHSQKSNE
jgi:hypothetical protein